MIRNVEFRENEAVEYQNFLKSNANLIMNDIKLLTQHVESLKTTYETAETEALFNEIKMELNNFETAYNSVNQQYVNTIEKVKASYQLAESKNNATFSDVGNNMQAASIALGSGAMTAAGFDFGKISRSAEDATAGNFVNNVNSAVFNEKGDYTFTYRNDGSVLVSKNGTAIGYTTKDNAAKVTGKPFETHDEAFSSAGYFKKSQYEEMGSSKVSNSGESSYTFTGNGDPLAGGSSTLNTTGVTKNNQGTVDNINPITGANTPHESETDTLLRGINPTNNSEHISNFTSLKGYNEWKQNQ